MASKNERRSSSRLVEKYDDLDDEYIEMDDDTTTMTPTQETQEEIPEMSWEDQEVREMVDPLENWRVIGLSNVGNTCFTNAILQVFS
jgi:ubiquitin C-terminal hydrolase